jgi:hypothetical protein
MDAIANYLRLHHFYIHDYEYGDNQLLIQSNDIDFTHIAMIQMAVVDLNHRFELVAIELLEQISGETCSIPYPFIKISKLKK